jgi:hypothetical protein
VRPELGELAAIQRAVHAAITGGAPVASAAGLVDGDGDGDGAARLAIYAHAYRARIAGVLASDVPVLRAVVGADWDGLVRDYLAACPPRHASLREAGDRLADFLARGPTPWLADLARLERARCEVFDAADAIALARADVAALPPDGFAALRLALIPAAIVVPLAGAADDLWAAHHDGADLAGRCPAPGPRTVLVWRRGLEVIHRTLPAAEAAAVALLAAGTTFAEVCAVAGDPAAAIELLLGWLDGGVLDRGQDQSSSLG